VNGQGVLIADAEIAGTHLDTLNVEERIETVGDAVRHWAEIRPQKAAFLTEDGQSISYGQLSLQFDCVGRELNDLSFGIGDRIAIVHPNNARLAVLLFGVAEAATAVPMNPALTEEEYTRMMGDLGVSALIVPSDSGDAARRAATGISVPVYTVHWDSDDLAATLHLEGPVLDRPHCSGKSSATDLAFVLGTSGTTGRSKIVPITHRLFLSRSRTRQRYEHTTSDDRCLFLNPLFLHNGLTTVGVTVASGADIVL
jgi:acyl-CoA synthetase (AMP-forming)/AMP-acid ligase II